MDAGINEGVEEFLSRTGQDLTLSQNDKASSQKLVEEYKRVLSESLISSFALDFLFFGVERPGGDFDTPVNVDARGKQYKSEMDAYVVRRRKADGNHAASDEAYKTQFRAKHNETEYIFANQINGDNYVNRGKYDGGEYRKDAAYKEAREGFERQRTSPGGQEDAYTGKVLKKFDLDHVTSAHAIHDSPSSWLEGINAIDIANMKENLRPTNPSLNRTKKDLDEDALVERLAEKKTSLNKEIAALEEKGNKRTSQETEELWNKRDKRDNFDIDEKKVREAFQESETARRQKELRDYFSNRANLAACGKQIAKSTGKTAAKQAVGLFVAEVWICVEDSLPEIRKAMKEEKDYKEALAILSEAVKNGVQTAKERWKYILRSVADGALSGALSKVSEILINCIAATCRSAARILRYCWSSLVESIKIILFNPEHLPAGEVFRAVAKLIATAAAAVVGGIVQEILSEHLGAIPLVGDILPTFVGCSISGIVSVTLIYYLDNSKMVQKLVVRANELHDKADTELQSLAKVNESLNAYAAELMGYDVEKFERDALRFSEASKSILAAKTDRELNVALKAYVDPPYEGTLDDFMNDSSAVLHFESE